MGVGEEILAVPRQAKVLIALHGTEHGVATGFKVYGIDADIIARQRENSGIGRLLLANPLQGFPGLDQLVDVQHADDDVPLVPVAHARSLQLHILGLVVKHHAIVQHEGMLALEGMEQALLIHGPEKRSLVLGMDQPQRVSPADLEEVLPRLLDAELLIFVCGTVFYKGVVLDIDVVNADVIRCQCLCDPQAIGDMLFLIHAPCAFPPGRVGLGWLFPKHRS